MPKQIPNIRVFISSPSDVNDERKIALDVVERLPYRPAFRERVAFRVVAWDKPGADTPMRATLTPQDAINQGLPKPSECEIVVVLFWSRMGTPFTFNGQDYRSGTHWELLDAIDSQLAETVVYRRMDEPPFKVNDPHFESKHAQYQAVQDFFQSDLFYAPDGKIRRGINMYRTPDDFRQSFETHFEALVVDLLKKIESQPSQQTYVDEPEDNSNIVKVEAVEWPVDKSPFPGLRAFTDEDETIFFGRGRETDALVKQVAESPFVVVVGASGSGKSSLVGAGLIPRLRTNAISSENTGSKDWYVVSFTPGNQPFANLAGALMDTVPALHASKPRTYAKEWNDFTVNLQEKSDSLTITLSNALKREKDWVEILLFIDQFEELFTLTPPDLREPFVLMMAEVAQNERVRVIATLRADFYHRAVEIPELADMLREGSFTLSTPKRDALREMIERPAERAHLELEEGLVERILDDTGSEPGNLALMAYMLDEIYRISRSERKLTHAAYDALHGVQGAIGERAETVFKSLPGDENNKERALQHIFQELVDVDDEGNATRRRIHYNPEQESQAVQQLVTALIDARLLTGDMDGVLEVAHEALLREWQRLKSWIAYARDTLRLRRSILLDAQEWVRRGKKDPDLLYRGAILAEAQRFILDYPQREPLASEFITASAQLEAKYKAAEKRAAQRTQILGFSLVSVLVIGSLALVLIFARNNATLQAEATALQAQAITARYEVAGVQPTLEAANTQVANAEVQLAAAQEQIVTATVQIITAEAQIARANIQVEAGQTQVAAFEPTVNAANAQIAEANAQIAEAGTQVAGVEPTVNAANAQIAFSNTQIAEGQTQVAGFEPTIDRANTQIAGVEPTLSAADAQIANANAQVAQGQTQVADFAPTIDAANTEIAGVEPTLSAANAQIAAANTQVAGVEPTLQAANEQILLANTQVAGFEPTINAADTQIAGVVPTLEAANEQISIFNIVVEAANTEIAGVEPTLHAANTQIAGVGPTLEAAESEIAGQRGIADALRLVRNADQLLQAGNPDLAISLVLQAYRLSPSLGEAQRILNNAIPLTVRLSITDANLAEFTPDGRFVIVGGNGGAEIWDLPTRGLLYTLDTDAVTAMVLSPDGEQVVIGTRSGDIHVFAVGTGVEYLLLHGHTATITDLDYNSSLPQIVSGDSAGYAYVWDLERGEIIKSLPEPHPSAIVKVTFREFTRAFTYNFITHADNGVLLPRIGVFGLGQVGAFRNDPPEYRGFSENGRIGYTGGDGQGFLTLYDADSMVEQRTFRLGNATEDYIDHIAFSNDGSYILVEVETRAYETFRARDRYVALWDIRTGGEIRRFNFAVEDPQAWDVNSLTFSRDGQFALVGGRFNTINTVTLWDVNTGQELRRFNGHNATPEQVAFSNDNTYGMSISDDGNVRIWEIGQGELNIINQTRISADSIDAFGISADGLRAYVAFNNRSFTTYDLTTNTEVHDVDFTTGIWTHVAFSPTEPQVLVVAVDRMALYDVTSRERLHVFNDVIPDEITAVTFSPDGQFLFYSTSSETFVWDVSNRTVFLELNEGGTLLASNNNNEYIAIGNRNTIQIYDMVDNEVEITFEHTGGTINSLDYSPHDDTVMTAIGEPDNLVIIWDIRTGVPRYTLIGHTAPVRIALYSPDGLTALSGADDGSLILWDLTSGQAIREYRGHTAPIRQIQFNLEESAAHSISTILDDGIITWRVESASDTINWVYANRYVREINCQERLQYGLQPFCEDGVIPTVPPTPTSQASATPTQTSTPRPTVTPTPTPVPTGTIFTDGNAAANIRSQPGSSFSLITQAASGTEVQILERRDDLGWWFIRLPDGTTGWILRGVVRLN
jgi:WD40 repeat protein/predicted  nucleic acid-binding Zn-ribbon protein